MKPLSSYLIATLLTITTAHSAITVPGADGSDGALDITEDTVIDLSLATPGDGVSSKWDSPNTANAGNGLYDPKQWAIVFKYSSVNIAAGTTLTFTNHPSRAPVMWLVNGDVTIEGTVSLNGESGKAASAALNAEPGPGGFRGGFTRYGNGAPGGGGFGPGGGQSARVSGSGHHASSYGNPSIVPLLGGSGGGGSSETRVTVNGGGAGGGALLIATTQTVHIDGALQSNGGDGHGKNDPISSWDRQSGAGSGGGIRIVTDTLTGTGTIHARGGSAPLSNGQSGRIRIERVTNEDTLTIVPDPSVVDLPAADTALVVPPPGAPEVRIVSITSGLDSANVPDDPRAEFGATGADVTLPKPESNTILVEIETTGVEQESQVIVRIASRSGGQAITGNAGLIEVTSNDPLVIRWQATITASAGYSEMSVRVVRP